MKHLVPIFLSALETETGKMEKGTTAFNHKPQNAVYIYLQDLGVH